MLVVFVQNCPYTRGERARQNRHTQTQKQKKVRVKWKQRKDEKATKRLKVDSFRNATSSHGYY